MKSTAAADPKLKDHAERRAAQNKPEVSIEQLKVDRLDSLSRLKKLEELFQSGGLSRQELEDHRLRHQLLEEEYTLRLRRIYR